MGLSLRRLPGRCTRNGVESGVTKQMLEDTRDSGIHYASSDSGESVPNKDPDVSERPSFIPSTT